MGSTAAQAAPYDIVALPHNRHSTGHRRSTEGCWTGTANMWYQGQRKEQGRGHISVKKMPLH